MEVGNEEDMNEFQMEIDKLSNWLAENKLSLIISKCAILTLSRTDRKLLKNYTMNNTILSRVKEFRDLGTFVDEKLNFKRHISTLIASCNSAIGFIGRTGRKFDYET